MKPVLLYVKQKKTFDKFDVQSCNIFFQQSVLSLQQHTDISDHGAKVLCEKLLNNIDDLERLHQLILWHPMTVPESKDIFKTTVTI